MRRASGSWCSLAPRDFRACVRSPYGRAWATAAVSFPHVKPRPCDYCAPATIAEAAGLLGELGEDAKPLAGGQSLLPMLALRLASFDHLVDLGGVDALAETTVGPDTVTIGATVRQRVLERDRT